ncbi:hypothetical protein ACFWVT_05675 [Streptomyces cyaneofuscatus]|uniref:hypothetical protein n=1 Tax=Streptomyces cyaneofuscatus TaxID=66883 RepID=UPI00365DFC81
MEAPHPAGLYCVPIHFQRTEDMGYEAELPCPMAISDEQLLNFDKERLAHWDEGRAEHTLTGEHGPIYRNHLEIAHWIDSWVENMERNDVGRHNPEQMGFVKGVREIAANLRQGDLVPNGILLQDS